MSTVAPTNAAAEAMLSDESTTTAILFGAEPGVAGQILRALTFPGHDATAGKLGAQQAPEFRDGVLELTGEDALSLGRHHMEGPWPVENDPDGSHYSAAIEGLVDDHRPVRYMHDGVQIDCMRIWVQGSDGNWDYWPDTAVLIFRLRKLTSERVLINDEYKTDEGWKDIVRKVVSGDVVLPVPVDVAESMATAMEALIAHSQDSAVAVKAQETLEAYRIASRLEVSR